MRPLGREASHDGSPAHQPFCLGAWFLLQPLLDTIQRDRYACSTWRAALRQLVRTTLLWADSSTREFSLPGLLGASFFAALCNPYALLTFCSSYPRPDGLSRFHRCLRCTQIAKMGKDHVSAAHLGALRRACCTASCRYSSVHECCCDRWAACGGAFRTTFI